MVSRWRLGTHDGCPARLAGHVRPPAACATSKKRSGATTRAIQADGIPALSQETGSLDVSRGGPSIPRTGLGGARPARTSCTNGSEGRSPSEPSVAAAAQSDDIYDCRVRVAAQEGHARGSLALS